ncbi:MAG: Lipopolysaccharide biosynthesis protein RfbH [Verrucomicrobiota bacterium]|jgi:CDP-6-deoxy-D-xylo-4-hexulose-3-dehydrase
MSTPSRSPAQIREEILRLTGEYARSVHARSLPAEHPNRPARQEGESLPYAARVFGAEEVQAAVGSALDFWLTLGPEGDKMERDLAKVLGVHKCLLVNSGSSANLIAVSALTSHRLPAHKRLRPGDEVITCAAGFPTTVAPILQNGLVPVFIDNDPVTGNARMDQLELAYSPGKTKAVIFAHTLGNPFDLATCLAFCRKHDLWLIEDNCDALGSTYSMPETLALELSLDLDKNLTPGSGRLTRMTGAWGDISTQSFYPPHHLTMGEGGSVNIVNSGLLKSVAESLRDWGRDCWCPSGKDNTCCKRFGWQLGELPKGYDHKYIYSHLGYNLKPTDIQAAIGNVQLSRLPAFTEARKNNWQALREALEPLAEHIKFSLPTHADAWTPSGFSWDSSACEAIPSWFGFMLLVKPSAPFTRTDLARRLDEYKIGNRMLFGGNLVRQPAFVQLRHDNPQAFRTPVALPGADQLMNEAIFIGVYPGIGQDETRPILKCIQAFCPR